MKFYLLHDRNFSSFYMNILGRQDDINGKRFYFLANRQLGPINWQICRLQVENFSRLQIYNHETTQSHQTIIAHYFTGNKHKTGRAQKLQLG